MRLMNEILENRLLDRWGKLLPRAPAQVGGLQETDAELVDLGDGRLLALTVDAVVEEVNSGLYREPRTVGRVAAASSLSDLAAVGADALGVLVCATLPRASREAAQTGVAEGLRETLDAAGVFVLGGDTNEAEQLSLALTAAGLVPRDGVVTRVGTRPGDRVYVSGPLGAGGALAASVLLGLGQMSEDAFRPVARLREGRLLRGIASCCMDTSDGFVATIDQLARINEVGFRIEAESARLLHPAAAAVCTSTGMPAFPFLASYHGEFELVFTVPPERIARFEELARRQNWMPMKVGVVEPKPGVRFADVEVDTARLRNAFEQSGGDVSAYLKTLLAVVVP